MRKINRFEQKNKVSFKERGKSPTDAALHYLSARARTAREVERYLDGQNYGEYEVQQAVERMMELGYINDKNYAEEFIRTRLNAKPVSRGRLYDQLTAHELPREIIEEALLCVTDEIEKGNALTVAEKFKAQLEGKDNFEQRLMSRLMSRGFSYDVCREAVREALENDDA